MRRTTLFFFITMLIGCTATGPAFEQVAEPQNEKAIAYFFRQAAFYGSGSCPDLIIDQKKMGCLKNGGFFEVELEPGEHTILFDKGTWEPDRDLRTNILVKSGKIYFYEYGQVMTGIFATPGFGSVSGEENFYRKTREYSVAILKKLKES
ncbi:DUF2846 domain-containing protein [Agarilytica rhodophyticola]|uniref:DUF2846 domain-containing protein n=1 Tax=Agarilytica rhodophyticola TaxID=1737490 RepID=UPI000B342CCF|nr:DUF2846 domain-containing protein [Agarilytica rhodophyticola]